MNENLDLTKILKDCPKGTKFYSRCVGIVDFLKIQNDSILVADYIGSIWKYNKNGKFNYSEESAEIDLFPSKDQRDWLKWQIPFVKGDVLVSNAGNIVLCSHIDNEQIVHYHCLLRPYGTLKIRDDVGVGYSFECTLATEEEKQRIFDAIKKNGYKWNAENKVLEKLTIEPKFKVGDTIRSKNGLQEYKITNVTSEYYSVKVQDHACVGLLPVKDQNDWILVKKERFNPKTLQHFDKVLVRQYDFKPWCIDFYSHYDEDEDQVVCTGEVYYDQCIPYNDDTKHLVGKSEEAPKFYKYWKE